MHLIWENLVKNLITLWTGKFKGLDEGVGNYHLAEAIWKGVGADTATAGTTIPSAYGCRVPNIAQDGVSVTAEMWSFWSLYLGPALLRRRFKDKRYYNHFIDLVKLLNQCLQFEITKIDIQNIRSGFIKWVNDYESYYYQHDPMRISACPVTIHALLHIADGIEEWGPVWCYWAFPMERYCGKLQPAFRSRRFPYASLDRFVVEDAQLSQIKLTSGCADEIALKVPRGAVQGTYTHPFYPTCMLLPPCIETQPSKSQLQLICAALATRVDAPISRIRPIVNKAHITQWGKVRRVDSTAGDTIHAASIVPERYDSRNATYVRYEAFEDKNQRYRNRNILLELKTFYGQLQSIFVIKFEPQGQAVIGQDTVILAAVTTCNIEPDVDLKQTGLDLHTYTNEKNTNVVDITSIQCLVGRVKDDRGWVIIDRSGGLARAVVEDDDDEDSDTT
ncbi:hypothetical protein BDN72DRAFT_773358 [Pluteus cervinus]|uniref:Uncharacterized protein n=1 Tax=Pluteus cervinus TaxID=181527 RepID=A0ACD3AIP3_9AGAR|nr:hypothetical protein BDN72DRAFT_773358 [Pluteus cervinus]